MCIIAIFKNGKRPDKATIKRMMNTNRDGAGIAWNTGRSVAFRKGFTTVESVEAWLNRLDSVGGCQNIVFHARIGTSGGISAEKCHPYPLTACVDNLNRVKYSGNAPVVFHNGVFPIDIESGLNDSQTFVKNMLYPLYKSDPRGLATGKYDPIIEMAVKGSRLVIVYPDGFRAYGTGWQEEDEAWYSNSGYKEQRAVWRGGYGHWYDEYDDEYWSDYEEWRDSDTKKTFHAWRHERNENAKKGVTS